MKKFITDVHNHSTYSFDGVDSLSDMLKNARKKGVDFYGVSEHFDIDVYLVTGENYRKGNEEYFHAARHLQEDYEGVMNVTIGCEFSFADCEKGETMYAAIQEKYRPDFIVNSVHTLRGEDYCDLAPYYSKNAKGERVLREKAEVYKEYLSLVRRSLDVQYDYDIVGHIGYVARYAPYENKSLSYKDFAAELDEIFLAIIKKDKILEVNAATIGLSDPSVPSRDLIERYFELGGRKISYASDAHSTSAILRKREEIVVMLKSIGFTHITVPRCREHIQVEL